MNTLVFLVEEPSAKALLEVIVPTLLPEDWTPHFVVFEGKQDLDRRLVQRLRLWLRPHTRFLVLRDQDSGDCKAIKAGLTAKCREAGRPDAVVRIACRELEAFLVGDWQAVAAGLGRPGLADLARKAVFRDPDRLGSPADELSRHVPGYQKLDGARRIAPHLVVDRNASRSFRSLVAGIERCVQGGDQRRT